MKKQYIPFIVALVIALWGFIYFYNLSVMQKKEIDSLAEFNTTMKAELEMLTEERKSTTAELLKSTKDLEDATIERDSYKEQLEIIEEDLIKDKEEIERLTALTSYVHNGSWDYEYTEEDIKILAGVMYAENYVSGRWEMMLTGSVVLNRVISDKFPNTIKDVVYQSNGKYEQYAGRTKRLIGSDEVKPECYELAKILLEYGPVAPSEVVFQAHFNQGNIYWEYNGEQFCYK